jgi:hypothetical protein
MNVQGAAGDLEKFEMHQGTLTLNCVSNSNVIPNATKLGGGTVTSDGGNPTQSTSGDLYDFTMTGGTLAINCPSEIGSYASQTNTQRAQFETTIGGGGILTARRNNSGTFTANLGSLKSFNMSGGNIINYGAFCNRVNGSMIGAGSLLDGTPTATAHTVITNYGTIGTFNITGGSMLMTRDNTTTYNFKSSEGNERIQKNPTDALGRILYPVYVPTVINGFNTIGKTVNIASLAYSAALQDYSAYDSFNTYTGVL